MNRFIQIFNFIGVLALAALCGVQWQANERITQTADHLERVRVEQTTRITDQDKTIKDDASHLDDLGQQLSLSETALKDTQIKMTAAEHDRDRISADRDQLKKALDQWVAAIAARDAAIKQAGEQIQKLSTERNDAVTKLNDLVGKYNDLVAQASAAANAKR